MVWPIPFGSRTCLDMPWNHHTWRRWTRWMVSRQRLDACWWHWPKEALVCMMMRRRRMRMIIWWWRSYLSWHVGQMLQLLDDRSRQYWYFAFTCHIYPPRPSFEAVQRSEPLLRWPHKAWIHDIPQDDDSICHWLPSCHTTCLQPTKKISRALNVI